GRWTERRAAIYAVGTDGNPRHIVGQVAQHNRARGSHMDIPDDIFAEPEDIDPEALANLGPLCRLAGVWEGNRGVDINPKADGPEQRSYYERIEMQPIDPQTNGPQLLYGLRYHIHVNAPDEEITFHD